MQARRQVSQASRQSPGGPAAGADTPLSEEAEPLRQAIYMPALVATRFNPDLKAKYNQLTNAGKPAKVALTAVMRKLILLANALLKANRTWTPKPA